jgi:hypothetical protein
MPNAKLIGPFTSVLIAATSSAAVLSVESPMAAIDPDDGLGASPGYRLHVNYQDVNGRVRRLEVKPGSKRHQRLTRPKESMQAVGEW